MLAKKTQILKFIKTKPHCNIGTIGHVDHGKTTLTAAITKTLQGIGNTIFFAYHDIDNHVEERNRGITINAAHIEYETEKRHYSHIDCPGHQQYVKNMLTGAVQMEGAILVVAVNDGPQVQTREHIILAKEVGIPYLIIYINKLDLMLEGDMKDLVELEVRELLDSYGFLGDVPCIKGSARIALEEEEPTNLGTGSVKILMDTVDSYIKQPERVKDAPFLMAIEGIFMATGRGTVLTGKIETGIVKIGDLLEVIGGRDNISTQCLGLEMFRKSLDIAEAGENVGILVKAVKRDDVRRGFVLSSLNSIKAYDIFKGKIYILTKKEGGRHKPFITNYTPQFFLRTANITGSIILPEEISAVMPGDSLIITIKLVDKIPAQIGDRFVMREGNITIGAGVILEFLTKI
jgi:elongation factor Tu